MYRFTNHFSAAFGLHLLTPPQPGLGGTPAQRTSQKFARPLRYWIPRLLGLAVFLLSILPTLQSQQCHCDDPNATIVSSPGVTTNLTTAINQGLLLPASQAATTPQNVCIRGTLNVNTSYTFTTSQLNMDAEAFITVSGFLVTLTINNSSVYGCDEMWNSITANPLSLLRITSSTIEDGVQAVFAWGGSGITLQNNLFRNNHIGLHAFTSFPGFFGLLTLLPLTGNTFNTTDDLLPPHQGELGFAGIQVTNINGFTIGTTNGSAPSNHFENLQNGIVATRSAFTLDGATFTGMINPVNPILPNADDVIGNGVFVRDRCNLTASDNEFNDCTVAIHAVQSSLNVFNNAMEDEVIFGVRVNGANMVNVNIHDNFMLVPRMGIQILNAINNSTVTVRNNDITTIDLDLEPITFDGFAGIVFSGCNFQPNNPGIIEDNSLDLDATLYGIGLNNSSFIRILDNSVIIQPIEPGEIGFSHGIFLGGSQWCLIAQINEVLGINFEENVLTRGFVNTSSMNNRYCCNIVNGTFQGMNMEGNSLGTDFYWTTFGEAVETGLYYDGITGPIGGLDINPNNRWSEDEEDYGIAGALNDGSNEPFIEMSQHFSFPFEPPTLPPSMEIPNAPGADWFTPGEAEEDESCPVAITCDFGLEKEELDATDHIIADRDWDSGKSYHPTLQWQAERYLLQELERDPDLMDGETEVQDFYSDMEDSTAQLFNGVDKNIRLLDTVASVAIEEYVANLSTISNKLDSLRLLDSLIWEETSPSELADLQDEKSDVLEAIADIEAENEDLFEDIALARSAPIGAIVSQNASIAVTEIFEENEKIVNDIWLRTAARGNANFDTTQLSQLEDIAWQCPLEGGNSVYKARSLYLMVVDTVFDDYALCYEEERSALSPPDRKDSRFGLQPNPAYQSVTLTLSDKILSFARIVITDLYGGQVFQSQIPAAQSKFTFPVHFIPSGIYFCRVYRDDEEVFSEKLLIIH